MFSVLQSFKGVVPRPSASLWRYAIIILMAIVKSTWGILAITLILVVVAGLVGFLLGRAEAEQTHRPYVAFFTCMVDEVAGLAEPYISEESSSTGQFQLRSDLDEAAERIEADAPSEQHSRDLATFMRAWGFCSDGWRRMDPKSYPADFWQDHF